METNIGLSVIVWTLLWELPNRYIIKGKYLIENNTTNASETWKVVNKLVGRDSKTELPDKFIVRNETVTDPLLIANELNYYFTSIGDRLAEKFAQSVDYKIYLNKNISTEFSFVTVSTEDIKQIVSSFKDSSAGVDGNFYEII